MTTTRQDIIQKIENLPAEVLPELASFVDRLRHKSGSIASQKPSNANGLLSLARLGDSGQTDISDRAEDILATEIDPVRGWTLK